MASAILLPFHSLLTVTVMDMLAGEGGLPTGGFQFQKCLDSDRSGYAKIWNYGDQSIRWHYASVTLPTTVFAPTATYTPKYALYIRGENALGIIPVTNEGNTLHWDWSTNGTTLVAVPSTTYVGYGDEKSLDSDGESMVLYTEDSSDCQAIFACDYQPMLTFVWQLATIDQQSSGSNAQYKIFNLMAGILVTLPDKLVVERAATDTWSGGEVSGAPFGQQRWNGLTTSGKRTTRTLHFEGLSETERALIVNILKYGRGCIPVLLCEDLANKTTWLQAILTHATESEPNADLYNLDLTAEEV
jgi:hypothetical protein